jgi:hypothetical protein
MPTYDIIDNRSQRPADHINRILASTDSARFAVGYFFLSGLTSIAERLTVVKELRLLIGNTPIARPWNGSLIPAPGAGGRRSGEAELPQAH